MRGVCCDEYTEEQLFSGLKFTSENMIRYLWHPYKVKYAKGIFRFEDSFGEKISIRANQAGMTIDMLKLFILNCNSGGLRSEPVIQVFDLSANEDTFTLTPPAGRIINDSLPVMVYWNGQLRNEGAGENEYALSLPDIIFNEQFIFDADFNQTITVNYWLYEK